MVKEVMGVDLPPPVSSQGVPELISNLRFNRDELKISLPETDEIAIQLKEFWDDPSNLGELVFSWFGQLEEETQFLWSEVICLLSVIGNDLARTLEYELREKRFTKWHEAIFQQEVSCGSDGRRLNRSHPKKKKKIVGTPREALKSRLKKKVKKKEKRDNRKKTKILKTMEMLLETRSLQVLCFIFGKSMFFGENSLIFLFQVDYESMNDLIELDLSCPIPLIHREKIKWVSNLT